MTPSQAPGQLGSASRLRRAVCGAASIALAIGVVLTILFPLGGVGSAAGEGSAGTDVSLPNTASAVTVSAADFIPKTSPLFNDYQNLKITVDQTQDLVNQAVSVTWSGGAPTLGSNANAAFNGKFAGNYLQLMECWSTDKNTAPTPEQCEFGGQDTITSNGTTPVPYNNEGVGGVALPNEDDENSRNLANDYPDGPPPASVGAATATNGTPWMPFDGVDGKSVGASEDPNQTVLNVPAWLNSYFNSTNTNEDDFALTAPDGTGAAAFTVDTGNEAPGLGCGKASVVNASGANTVPQCWLVIVPRGTPPVEDPLLQGTALATDAQAYQTIGVITSPLAQQSWQNHIAIPLGFDPIASSCSLSNQTQIVGDEIAQPAVDNWEPSICTQPGAASFNYNPLSDDLARQEFTSGTVGIQQAPGMAVTSQPIDPSSVTATPVTYAPLTLSGIVIGFNIQRSTNADSGGTAGPDQAEDQLNATGLQHIFLTPRLVAKLLTDSYLFAFPPGGPPTTPGGPPVGRNLPGTPAQSLFTDPDFLQYNPEFKSLKYFGDPAISAEGAPTTVIVEEASSDAAAEVWQWILADPAAKAWLNGTPDEWGMVVNPYYDTNPKVNPTGVAFASPAPNNFPIADPFTYTPAGSQTPTVPVPPEGLQDFWPYANSMQVAATEARAASNGAKTTFTGSAPSQNPGAYYTASGAEPIGQQAELTITSSASSNLFDLQTASLSAAGDDGANPTFVAPTTASFQAAEGVMKPASINGTAVPGVLAPNVSAVGQYPLTALTYAAVMPNTLTASARQAYASFLTFATGTGQTAGTAFGNLIPGYSPLPASLLAQDQTAIKDILAGGTTSTSPTTTTTAPNGTSSSSTPNSTGANGTGPGGISGTGGSLFPGGNTTNPAVPLTSSGSGSGLMNQLAQLTAANGPGSGPGAKAAGASTPGSKAHHAELAGSTVMTPGVGVSSLRWLMPIFLIVGVLAALGSRILALRRPIAAWIRNTIRAGMRSPVGAPPKVKAKPVKAKVGARVGPKLRFRPNFKWRNR